MPLFFLTADEKGIRVYELRTRYQEGVTISSVRIVNDCNDCLFDIPWHGSFQKEEELASDRDLIAQVF